MTSPGRGPTSAASPAPGCSPPTSATPCLRRSTPSRPSSPASSSSFSRATRTSTRRSSVASRSWRERRAPSCTRPAAATTRSPPTSACGASASCSRSPLRSWACKRCSPIAPTVAGDDVPARLYPPPASAAGAARPSPARPRLGAGPRRRPPRSTPSTGSTCPRSAPERWPDRRLPSIRRALPPTSASLAPFDNSLDAVSDRDFVAEALFDLTLARAPPRPDRRGVGAVDDDEFGFVRLDDAYSTGLVDVAAEEEPRHRRARPRQGGPVDRQPHRPAGHAERTAARLQPRPAGGQGAAVRLGRRRCRWRSRRSAG